MAYGDENFAMDRRRNGARLSSHDRYHRDPLYRALVDQLYYLLSTFSEITPTELREATMLAAEKYEYMHVRPMMFGPKITFEKTKGEDQEKCIAPTQTELAESPIQGYVPLDLSSIRTTPFSPGEAVSSPKDPIRTMKPNTMR